MIIINNYNSVSNFNLVNKCKNKIHIIDYKIQAL